MPALNQPAPSMGLPQGRAPSRADTANPLPSSTSAAAPLASSPVQQIAPAAASGVGIAGSVVAPTTIVPSSAPMSAPPAAAMDELEITLPQTTDGTPATMPAALASPNPYVSQETQEIIDGMASDFANSLEQAPAQSDEEAWKAAKAKSDDRFRAVFGQDAYNAYHIKAALEAQAAAGQNENPRSGN